MLFFVFVRIAVASSDLFRPKTKNGECVCAACSESTVNFCVKYVSSFGYFVFMLDRSFIRRCKN